jgi:transcriptional regulator with XRE-family HTH domain
MRAGSKTWDWETTLAGEATTPGLEAHMGERIAAQRGLMGLSVEALAKRAGLPLMRVQAYEAGLRRVVAPDLLRLCDALQVGPAYFLAGVPHPHSRDEDA